MAELGIVLILLDFSNLVPVRAQGWREVTGEIVKEPRVFKAEFGGK